MLSILFVVFSCKKDPSEPKPDLSLKSIFLSDSNLELLLGSSHTLKATLNPTNAVSATLIWSSSKEDIIKVDKAGKLEAIGVGESLVTVRNSDGTVSASCKVVVKPISATQMLLDKSALTLIIGSKDKLNVRFVPENTTNQEVLWTSSNPLVVKVDAQGNIEGVAVGEAVVTAKTLAGDPSAECKIVVSLPAITGLDIDKKDVQVLVGEDVQYKAVTTPPNAQPEELVWSSSDNNIATISLSSGLAKTLKPGKTIIKVTSKSGHVTATTALTVLPVKVQSILLGNEVLNLNKGVKFKLNYTVLPAEATDKTVKFELSNNNVATVDQTGTLTTISEGETMLTVSSNDGAATSKLLIKVTAVKVKEVTLSKTAISLLLGQSELVTANILPGNAENKNILWESSNEAIAIVDKQGKITSIAIGKATITANAADGGAKAYCEVEVSTIDKFVKIAAKPNSLVSSSASGNSAKLSVGIYNPTSAPIRIKFVKLFVNDVLSKNYSVNDPDLSSGSYLYDLGPFFLGTGVLDMSTLMLGWTISFEYELEGVTYKNTVAVKRNVIGQVNYNDFFDDSNRSMMNKSMKNTIKKGSSLKLQ